MVVFWFLSRQVPESSLCGGLRLFCGSLWLHVSSENTVLGSGNQPPADSSVKAPSWWMDLSVISEGTPAPSRLTSPTLDRMHRRETESCLWCWTHSSCMRLWERRKFIMLFTDAWKVKSIKTNFMQEYLPKNSFNVQYPMFSCRLILQSVFFSCICSLKRLFVIMFVWWKDLNKISKQLTRLT